MKYKAKKNLQNKYLCELQTENKLCTVIFPMAQTFKQAKPRRFMIITLCSHYLDTQR